MTREKRVLADKRSQIRNNTAKVYKHRSHSVLHVMKHANLVKGRALTFSRKKRVEMTYNDNVKRTKPRNADGTHCVTFSL